MKIATWNVNSIRIRQQQVSHWLQMNPVDVLCLQETKVIDADFPKMPFEELGYHLYISGQPSYNGVALLSRQPLEDVRIGFTQVLGVDDVLAATFDQQKRVISGIFHDVRIVNLYVPNGADLSSDKYAYKLQWLKMLRNYLTLFKENYPQELCVCGDFNVAPEDKDIHNPKGKETHIMATPQERKALQEVLEIGLKDAFRKFTAEGGHYSWWDYRSGGFQRNRGWRIDHHFLTPKLYEQATSCTIDIEPRKQEKPSDHTPVIVEF
ncbi:exodeoxyribonuclease III [Gloeothece verrucosa]|uniref:Exodeoxyribonuclease III n=1 Tax=Gloeothece verrucosa (strain PCC 7822) TaxID=497965 RepID=E0U5Q5_GLOV7|nr:exodeoxyribonuclease III [Gloeothece verrucosa]ADN15896.1 exodeoxyribonuclease III [Gloeothece verrucosa PCC 7822]